MALENKLTEEQLFDQLISSLVHSAWVSLGKIKNPMNDVMERNLDQASIQIDMLDMLHKRMSGNLSENEEQYLGQLVRELKMNFVEEKNKPVEESTTTNSDEKDESIDEVKTGKKVPEEEKKSIPAENEAKENSNNEDEKSEEKE
ncbi:MAG TPA: DUF1844 domain-containing protein [Candidatus Marinimicrobia bacterium]|nr:DUF1844 domain-containing protein [Candidatus Neomarinimicrobiota bacterium]